MYIRIQHFSSLPLSLRILHKLPLKALPKGIRIDTAEPQLGEQLGAVVSLQQFCLPCEHQYL